MSSSKKMFKTIDEDIVISGMGGRYPESDSTDQFAHNLYNGVDMITADNRRWPTGLQNYFLYFKFSIVIYTFISWGKIITIEIFYVIIFYKCLKDSYILQTVLWVKVIPSIYFINLNFYFIIDYYNKILISYNIIKKGRNFRQMK